MDLQTLKASDVVAAAEATLGKDMELVVPFVPQVEDELSQIRRFGRTGVPARYLLPAGDR